MKSKLLDRSTEATFALIPDTDDEASLLSFAKKDNVTAEHFTAVDGFSRVVLGYFDREKKDCLPIPIEEQVEVVSLIGDMRWRKTSLKFRSLRGGRAKWNCSSWPPNRAACPANAGNHSH
jgi:hypothetical protein